jgi:hypothetical protein
VVERAPAAAAHVEQRLEHLELEHRRQGRRPHDPAVRLEAADPLAEGPERQAQPRRSGAELAQQRGGQALLAAQLHHGLVEQGGQFALPLPPAQPEGQLAGGAVELEVIGDVGAEQSRRVGAFHAGGDSRPGPVTNPSVRRDG